MERAQTIKEEIANSITHAVGLVMGIICFILYANWKESSLNGDISLLIYGISLVFLYTASTLLHVFRNPKWKKVFLVLDHMSIYIFIAACYTPLLIKIGSFSAYFILCLVWGLALIGVIVKGFFLEKTRAFGLLLYLLMGWLIVVLGHSVIDILSTEGFLWLLAGGLAYTFGVFFFVKDHIYFFHAIWHVFVLAGSACHFQLIVFHICPF